MIIASAKELLLAYKTAIINEQEDIQKCLEHIIINELINSDVKYKTIATPPITPKNTFDISYASKHPCYSINTVLS